MYCQASQVALMVKNPPANAGDKRDEGSVPGSERCPGGGHGNPLQDSCLENPMDRGAWGATVLGVTKSRTRLKQISTHARKRDAERSACCVGRSPSFVNLLKLSKDNLYLTLIDAGGPEN